jgi:hypothetical protein
LSHVHEGDVSVILATEAWRVKLLDTAICRDQTFRRWPRLKTKMERAMRFQRYLAVVFCCASALISAHSGAAEFERCKSGDEPNVICSNGLGNWGCNGPCKAGPVAIFTPPSGYQVCKPLITRRDIKGGECYFTGEATQLQLSCSAPNAGTLARVHEVTIYSVAGNASKALFDKYECEKW